MVSMTRNGANQLMPRRHLPGTTGLSGLAAALLLPMLLGISGAIAATPQGPIDERPAAVVAGTPDAPRGADEALHTQEHYACAVILALDPSERPYDICVRSLSKSLAEATQSRRLEDARQACAVKGLDPGTSAFATCVVSTE